jgi:outer membrane receptor protein involved in Fe transport
VIRGPAVVLAFLALNATAVASQPREGTGSPADSIRLFLLEGINVTALRQARSVFLTPASVVVLGPERVLRSAVGNLTDLFLGVPGLDAEGVGPAQRRPVIRGMRGQRVLLLEDGLRLNNARRRADSGEPTGLVWSSAVERVEVMRGPASVLYGSDAIGGVVNLVTRPAPAYAEGVDGFVEAELRTAGASSTFGGEVAESWDALGIRLSGGFRDVGSYRTSSGTFGALTLPSGVTVHDSGVRDGSLRLEARYDLGGSGSAFARHEEYRSEDSGFGWIDPDLFGPNAVKTRLAWPDQGFRRSTLGVRSGELAWSVADAVDATAYVQSNERRFLTEVFVPIPTVPGATTEVRSENFTDLDSRGLRLEVRKLVGGSLALTYGLDAYEDRSAGTDTSTTTVTGLGPTRVTATGGPQVPDARLQNVGLFVQAQWEATATTEVVTGLRYQDVRSRSLVTEGNDSDPSRFREGTVVASANLLHRLGDQVNLVTSVGRGFRTPNLVERFFTGFTGGSRGYWEANPDLGPETSLNLEAGLRLRTARTRAEVFVFQNTLAGGIVLEPTGDSVGQAVVYRNVNVEKLRHRGVELSAGVDLGRGWSVEGDWTLLDVEDRRNPDRVLADSYPSKLRGALRFEDGKGRVWGIYEVRRNGRRDTLEGTSPLGDRIPSFTVHHVRAGLRLFERHRLGVAVENLTDVLYSEALNTGFFRPEPGRGLVLTWGVSF